MNTVLEELFLGNIAPNERYYGNEKPFHEGMKRLTEYESKVSSSLTEYGFTANPSLFAL